MWKERKEKVQRLQRRSQDHPARYIWSTFFPFPNISSPQMPPPGKFNRIPLRLLSANTQLLGAPPHPQGGLASALGAEPPAQTLQQELAEAQANGHQGRFVRTMRCK